MLCHLNHQYTTIIMKAYYLLLYLFEITCLASCSNNHTQSQLFDNKDIVGIDVSHHQGDIDWDAVADGGVDYVYIKATEGKTFTDKMYARNRDLARKAGLLVGAYHFYSMKSTPEEQFKNFKRSCPKGSTDLIPMIDVEFVGKLTTVQLSDLGKGSKRLADLMEDYYGKKPLIYCSPDVYNWCIYKRFSDDYVLMLGHPHPTYPAIKGSKHYDIWQYTYKGRIKGVAQVFDMHKFHKKRHWT